MALLRVEMSPNVPFILFFKILKLLDLNLCILLYIIISESTKEKKSSGQRLRHLYSKKVSYLLFLSPCFFFKLEGDHVDCMYVRPVYTYLIFQFLVHGSFRIKSPPKKWKFTPHPLQIG